MPATKPSSTKLATPWQATLRPSNTFNVILWTVTALSFVTLWHCPVPLIAKFATVLITGIGSIIITYRNSTPVQLHWHNTEIRYIAHSEMHQGQLASGSYYSPLVLVLAIKSSTGNICRIPVWHDSVDATDYSWLVIRLKTTLPQTLL